LLEAFFVAVARVNCDMSLPVQKKAFQFWGREKKMRFNFLEREKKLK
jgi:hypothetical protein